MLDNLIWVISRLSTVTLFGEASFWAVLRRSARAKKKSFWLIFLHQSSSIVEQMKAKFEFFLYRSIFVETMSVDTLITQILNQAQKLVNADRASLFLVDTKTNQLYARYLVTFKEILILALLDCLMYLLMLILKA